VAFIGEKSPVTLKTNSDLKTFAGNPKVPSRRCESAREESSTGREAPKVNEMWRAAVCENGTEKVVLNESALK
jgi:hypothetical protein